MAYYTKMATEAQRQRVHKLLKQLIGAKVLTQADYRALLFDRFGVESAKSLPVGKCSELITHLDALANPAPKMVMTGGDHLISPEQMDRMEQLFDGFGLLPQEEANLIQGFTRIDKQNQGTSQLAAMTQAAAVQLITELPKHRMKDYHWPEQTSMLTRPQGRKILKLMQICFSEKGQGRVNWNLASGWLEKRQGVRNSKYLTKETASQVIKELEKMEAKLEADHFLAQQHQSGAPDDIAI